MSKELKVIADRVLEAANGCPDAKRVLEKLFPEVFEGDKRMPLVFELLLKEIEFLHQLLGYELSIPKMFKSRDLKHMARDYEKYWHRLRHEVFNPARFKKD